MRINIFTLFPEVHPGHLGLSVLGRALEAQKWSLNIVNIRDYAEDKHKQVDEVPYGGGPGMVMRPDVLDRALEACYGSPADIDDKLGNGGKGVLLYPSPRGKPLRQEISRTLSSYDHIGLICGRFEGVDNRVLDYWQVREISIGDYVLTNGDLAAQVILDSILRLRPNILGDNLSVQDESFAGDGLLEYPHYTRPRVFRGLEVPAVLISGHHGEIAKWRQQQSYEITKKNRPDLLKDKANEKP